MASRGRWQAALIAVIVAGCSLTTGLQSPSPTTSDRPAAASSELTASPTPSPSPRPSVALVPVTGFWSGARAISLVDLEAAIAGRSARWPVVIGDPQLLGRLAAALDVVPGKAVVAGDTDSVRQRVAADPSALGIVCASDVGPSMRALAVDRRSLFGVHRVASLADWPLVVDGGPAIGAFDPEAEWTIVAGGDVMLDREIYRQTRILGGGIDLPWDGGTVRISARRCCNSLGNRLPVGERTGNDGAVRDLLQAADVALVNLEGPAPDAFRYHPTGLVFTLDPALLGGLAHAGIDLVDLANNHIGNAGRNGITQTVQHLDEVRIAHVGAGADLAAARAPSLRSAGGDRSPSSATTTSTTRTQRRLRRPATRPSGWPR